MINIRFQKVLNQISLGILLLMILSSCEKFDNISHNPNLKLSFSSDTIVFDTVFTSIGFREWIAPNIFTTATILWNLNERYNDGPNEPIYRIGFGVGL